MPLDRRSLIAMTLGMAGCALASRVMGTEASVRPRLGFQLHSLGVSLQADLVGSLRRIKEFGYETVEAVGLTADDAPRIKAAADHAELDISSVHLRASPIVPGTGLTLSSDIRELLGALRDLGSKRVVMSLMALPPLQALPNESLVQSLVRTAKAEGASLWLRTAALLNRRGQELADAGYSLCYHNGNIEFAEIEGTTGWEILLRQTQPDIVGLQIDVGWAAAAGIDPAALIEASASRVRQLHLKDVSASSAVNTELHMQAAEPGRGIIDWQAVVTAAHKARVADYIVDNERTPDADPFQEARVAAEFFKTVFRSQA